MNGAGAPFYVLTGRKRRMPPSFTQQRLTLLIVEDDQAMRQMCMSLFEREGFAAEGASSVAEAFERVAHPRERAPVSLVLSDVKLGRDGAESGIELLRK